MNNTVERIVWATEYARVLGFDDEREAAERACSAVRGLRALHTQVIDGLSGLTEDDENLVADILDRSE